jgi:succinate dehydrogenase/fumarate reductase cytochrome b subunit
MENTNRSVFAFHGLTGGLIATALLLTILVVLTVLAIQTQQANAETFYKIKDETSIKMIDKNSAANRVIVK